MGYTINVIKRGESSGRLGEPKRKKKEYAKMKMYELKKLTDQIESETARKIKLVGSVSHGTPIVYLYLNNILMWTLCIEEIYHELVSIISVVTALKYGRNQVKF